ncbi:sensor histidine kinase [Pseudocnuella soli]|uniref:sensor histidine kinase n=1 Tax=Pseudocnuella soli TaxID=2502779 RepID=UPI0010434469|nr:histidine kinase [Pseudocnuella soli]
MTTPLKDTWIRIVNPVILIALSIISQQTLVPPVTTDKLAATARLIILLVFNFELGRMLVIYARRKFPAISATKKRVLYAYALCVAGTFVLITISTLISRYYMPKPVSFWFESLLNFIQSFWIGALIMAPYEVLYTYALSVRTEQQRHQLEKEHIQTRLHSLQAKVNPHFLFNSLNTLSALTTKDPQKAEAFVLEMSAVYRYLLHNNTAHLATVAAELDFIRSYLHLLQTRYGTALQIDIEIEESVHQYNLPPFSLQLLVENAVKHNEVSSDAPLNLYMYNKGVEYIVVTNNIQPKTGANQPSGFGLSGLSSRYHLLDGPEIEIIKTTEHFTVKLPLIKPSHQ